MAKIVLPVFLICLVVASPEALASDSVNVYVAVEGFKSGDGLCRLLLFESTEGFPDSPGEAVTRLSGKIHGQRAVFRFRVRPGRYAIAILHDENSNEEMDQTWYGRPTEGFGASNNPKPGFGPPEFEESAVNLDAPNNHLTITLNYL